MLSLGSPIVLAAGAVVAIGAIGAGWYVRRRQYQARMIRLQERWLVLQKQCSQPKLWPNIVVEADILIDDALKAVGFKGRSMGERLVAAQRKLTNNDGVWFGHKLRNKISQDEISRLYKRDVQTALRAVRQALQDLGVL